MEKTAFTFKNCYWTRRTHPQWWSNFTKNRDDAVVFKDLKPFAKVRRKSNGDYRVVFNSSKALTFFMLKWS